MFRAGLLLIIRRYYSVYSAVGICVNVDWLFVGSGWKWYGYITMHGQQILKYGIVLIVPVFGILFTERCD